jgi:membrane protease YdiL (CAAX protease family)
MKEMPDQLAVEYVKAALKNPIYFVLAVANVSLFAPFIEELLFRGFLQTYLTNRFSTKIAIVLTSVLFAIFHFAPEQKLSNITILSSLFVLSCFLGFLYEKQKYLLSQMILHAAFNLISIFNLFFFKGN